MGGFGSHAHAMAGFNREKAYEILQAPADEYDIMAAIAVGRRAEPSVLPENIAANDVPSGRQLGSEVFREGCF